MAVKYLIKKGLYFDSLKLMGISSNLSNLEGVKQGVVAMATLKNKEMLKNFDLLNEELEALGNGDLMIVVRADSEETCDEALTQAQEMISGNIKQKKDEVSHKNLSSTVNHVPDANLVVISLPGEYAAAEARKALEQDLHVMLFSDNVSLEDEVALKEYAHENGLLLMGPDCGTAIIGNVALCFANEVRPGNIGLAGASGTGGQEVTVLIDQLGGGITHYLGTGGRDLSAEVGGLMMLDVLDALDEDENSEVVVILSKPPVQSVAQKILDRAAAIAKPVVVCFIGGVAPETVAAYPGLHFATSLEDAAVQAVKLSGVPVTGKIHVFDEGEVADLKHKLKPGQKYIHGLYSGGTLCGEAMEIAQAACGPVYGNLTKDPAYHLSKGEKGAGHVFLDFGEDEYTEGKPHPMIEPSQRNEEIVTAAQDPSTAVILMDFVLGYGSHADPVGATLPYIERAKAAAAKNDQEIIFIGYVCGTAGDFQGYDAQRQALREAGVIVADSNYQAAKLTAALV